MIFNFLVCNIIFICIKFLQRMDAFDCIVKTDSNLASLPQDVLNIIRPNYIELLEEEAAEIIANRKENILYTYLKEDIQNYGYNYSYLSHCRHSLELCTPEWLIKLGERLYLKYETDFVHCLSQLKRFAGYFKQGDLSRTLQFGYDLGRLQEISDNPDHTIFWEPVERLFLAQDWNGLDAYIDTLQKRFQIGYDTSILEKAQ
jgi:hypothetical protein